MIDCVVVGAGPAGLAASAALAARGVDHVVLERDRAGETWRSQRWDSFRRNTVGWMNELLGEQPPDAYLTGLEVVERLERLADGRPIREGVLDCSLWCEYS
jgi:putative flavoprotein involved in K+ transport